MKTSLVSTLGFALVLSLGAIALIGCGDDSESEAPACRDGNCDSGVGGGSSNNCGGLCVAPSSCNTVTQQCNYVNSACNACGAGTYCDTSTSPPSCKSNTTPGTCSTYCGPGTTCVNSKCMPGTGGSGGTDSCNNACGSGTYCSNGHCLPNGSGGSGGDGGTGGSGGYGGSGGSKLADVTWKPTLTSSTLGWVDATSSSDGTFNPQSQTVTIYTGDGSSAVCAVLYGQKNTLVCAGNCEWWDAYKPVFAPKHGKSPDDLSYVAGLQGLKDAAADLLVCRNSGSGACTSEFVWRAAGSGAWQDNEAVADSQSQLACAFVPSSGVVETH